LFTGGVGWLPMMRCQSKSLSYSECVPIQKQSTPSDPLRPSARDREGRPGQIDTCRRENKGLPNSTVLYRLGGRTGGSTANAGTTPRDQEAVLKCRRERISVRSRGPRSRYARRCVPQPWFTLRVPPLVQPPHPEPRPFRSRDLRRSTAPVGRRRSAAALNTPEPTRELLP